MIEMDPVRHPRLTEGLVQLAIADYVGWARALVVPNVHLPHEMDVAVLTRAGCLWEFEIKLSQSDWEVDRRKDERKPLPKYFAQLPPGDEPGQRGYYEQRWCDPQRNLKHVERFTYVYAEGLRQPTWLPDYAGLIEVQQRTYDGKVFLRLHPVRSAKSRRAPKLSEAGQLQLLRSIYYRYWQRVKGLEPVVGEAMLDDEVAA